MARKDIVVSAMGVWQNFVTALAKELEVRGVSLYQLITEGMKGDSAPAFVERVAGAILKEIRQWKIFKTIKLGTGLKTADDFRRALHDGGFKVGNWADNILGKLAFTVVKEETEIDLVVVSVREIGFKDGARRDQIYSRAQDFGLELCPPEVGSQLRLQYPDQPMGEWLRVAMDPIADSDGGLRVFSVRHGGGEQWLRCSNGTPDGSWGPGSQWAFVCPRK